MPPISDIIDDDREFRRRSLAHAPGFWTADIIYVLLVEDDDVDAKLIELYAAELTNPQVVVTRAVSASEARRLLAEWTFDLCILDFWLGCESTLRLLAELGGLDVVPPTIVLTSLSTPDIGRMCQKAGASFFIGKEGLGPASLQAAILAAIRTTARISGVPETREDRMVRLLTRMLGVADAESGEEGATSASAWRRHDGSLVHGQLAMLLDMTETVRFGLFERVLTTRRPLARIRDAGALVEGALDIARGVFSNRDQRVSLRRPEVAVVIRCDPAAFLFVMFELVLRASQQSASNSHIGISLATGPSAIHIALVSDLPANANASALALGPLLLQVLSDCRGTIHNVSGEDGRLRLEVRLKANATADQTESARDAIMVRGLSGGVPAGRNPYHHSPDAG